MRTARLAAAIAVAAGIIAAPEAQASFPGRDGRIAFVRSGDIYTIRADGTDVRRITSTADTDGNPAWSPDGRKIAFTRLLGSNFEIHTMASDGSGLRRLTFNTAVDKEPAWSSDGTRLAFASSRYGNYDVLTIRSSDGLELRRATSTSWNETHPSYSPNSWRIAFQRSSGDRSDLYSVPDPRMCPTPCPPEIRHTDTPDAEREPSWAPDGRSLIFTGRLGDTTAINRVWVQYEIYTRLAYHSDSLVAHGTCSPSGERVVYTRVRSNLPNELRTTACSGGEPSVRLTTGYDADWQRAPSIAPPGEPAPTPGPVNAG